MIVYYSKKDRNKLEHFIRQTMEKESDSIKRKDAPTDILFCKEKGSPKEAFEAVPDGLKAYFENVEFETEFVIPGEWIKKLSGVERDEVLQNTQRRAEYAIRSYYRFTRRMLEAALANATESEAHFKGFVLDLRTPDGEPLFSENHLFGDVGRQSNLFKGNFFGDEKRTNESLDFLSDKIFDMKDELGKPLRYVADTIIIPVNRTNLFRKLIKAIAAQDSNHWKLITLPSWYSNDDRLMIMSSNANIELCGNMFWNRVPLVVTNWTDAYTDNCTRVLRSRVSVSFNTYKHILLAIDPSTAEDPL